MRYVQLLRRPAPLLLWLGQVASAAGDRLYALAVMWVAYQITGSTAMMGLVSLVELVPYVLMGLVGGVLIDRWDRYRIMIAADLARAALLLIIPLAHLAGALQPWHLMLVGIGLGALEALFAPALQASLTELVASDELPGINGLMDVTQRLARILGPGMAGVLLGWMDQVHFFTFDSVTFLLSAAMLTVVAVRYRPAATRKTKQRVALQEELWAGWRLALADGELSVALGVRAVNNLIWGGFLLGGPLLSDQRLGGGIAGYGLILAAYGAGSLVSNLLAGNGLINRYGSLRWFFLGWVVTGTAFLLLGLAPSLPWTLAAGGLAGVGGPIANVALNAYLGRRMPGEHLGKVFSLQKMLVHGGLALGTMIAGWVLEVVAPSVVVSGSGALMVLMAVAGAHWAKGAVRGRRRCS